MAAKKRKSGEIGYSKKPGADFFFGGVSDNAFFLFFEKKSISSDTLPFFIKLPSFLNIWPVSSLCITFTDPDQIWFSGIKVSCKK